MDSAGERFEAICAALADRNNILTVKDLYELAGVSRSGYYNWVRSEKNRELREAKDRAAFEQILEAYRFRGYAKGVRGIHMRLLHMGIRMNVKKIRRLMRKYKLTCPIRKPNPYRRLQRSIRMGSAAKNWVNREFESHGPRAILLTDITYIPLCGRFCYLSTILDACTKQVLAYVMSGSLEVDFVLETVQLLVKHHGISLSKETVIHSDQGTHYTSLKFIQLVENSALRRSMSRRGNCWDNAPQESFFGHMKDELASEIPGWTSFEAAKASIDRWMDYYNNDRCQWDLAKLSPNEYYHYITTGEYPAGTMRRCREELSKLFKRLYEDNVLGRVTDEQYRMLAGDYTGEQKALEEQIPEKEARLEKLKATSANVNTFVEKAKQYTAIDELTPELLRLFIQRIEVGERTEKYSPQLPPEHPHRLPRHRHSGQRDGAGRGAAAHCAAPKRDIPASRIIKKQRKNARKRTVSAVRPLARHGVNLCPYEHYPVGFRSFFCLDSKEHRLIPSAAPLKRRPRRQNDPLCRC